jgi:hypothetical protein
LYPSSPAQDWVPRVLSDGVRLNAERNPAFKSAITSLNSGPLAVITGVAIACKQASLIRTGPGTRKQSPSWVILESRRGRFLNNNYDFTKKMEFARMLCPKEEEF